MGSTNVATSRQEEDELLAQMEEDERLLDESDGEDKQFAATTKERAIDIVFETLYIAISYSIANYCTQIRKQKNCCMYEWRKKKYYPFIIGDHCRGLCTLLPYGGLILKLAPKYV